MRWKSSFNCPTTWPVEFGWRTVMLAVVVGMFEFALR
jgi:hypothetical protein